MPGRCSGPALRKGSPVSDPAHLDYSADEMRSMLDAVSTRVVAHLASLATQPSCGDTDVDALCEALREAAPDQPQPLASLLDTLFRDLIPRSYNTAGPGYLAFIPGGGVFPAALADLIADTTNRYTGVRFAAPALVQLEANVLDWLRDWMQFPATTRGLLTTGGSMANFNAIVCARESRLGADVRRGVMYVSSQAHHSVTRAARLAGIMPDRVRVIPVDGAFRMRVDRLAEALTADRRAGLEPFAVISNAGTTNTGAVDPLDAIADLCQAEGVWHHVDGAYGAFFYMCDELRPLMAGLPRADSLTLDPHKGLFLPYGTGALLVASGAILRAAHDAEAPYFPAGSAHQEFYDPHHYGPDLSRGFPGLRVWLTVKLFGAAKLKAAVAEKRALAVQLAERVSALPGLVMVAPPQLSLFAFHLTWPGATLDEENATTERLMNDTTARGRVMITGCRVDDRFLGRVCVLSFRTRQDRIDACADDLAAAAAAILPR